MTPNIWAVLLMEMVEKKEAVFFSYVMRMAFQLFLYVIPLVSWWDRIARKQPQLGVGRDS
jgi:hypothetical protein